MLTFPVNLRKLVCFCSQDYEITKEEEATRKEVTQEESYDIFDPNRFDEQNLKTFLASMMKNSKEFKEEICKCKNCFLKAIK